MRKQTKLKAFMLSLMMLTNIFLPATVNAQKSDGFFRESDNFNGNRFAAEGAIINNGIGQSEAPLGSGLLVLTAFGAGYVALKKKEEKI